MTTAEVSARVAIDHEATVLANLYDAVIGVDAAWRINAWNRAAERAFGCAPAEVMTRRLDEVVATRFASGWSQDEFRRRLDRDGRVKTEARRQARDGTWLDLEMTAAVIRGGDDSVVGYVSVNRDISARRRMEAALRSSQARLRQILECTGDGVWVVDAQGRTELVNARALELLGLREADVEGRPFWEVLPKPLRAQALSGATELPRGAERPREIRVVSADGAPRWLVMSRSLLHDPDGAMVGAVAVLMDVTAWRQARDELQQAQRLEAVGRLAAGLAHELNTPIQYIGDNTRFLGEALDALLAARSRDPAAGGVGAAMDADRLDELDYFAAQAPKTVDRTLEGVQRVANIVRAMKEFARPDQKQIVAIDLNRALEATLEVARSEYRHVADVVTELGALPPVRCFAGALNQVFLNLVVNAAHAIEDAGARGRGIIRVRTVQVDADVVIEVEDTGCGIAERHRDKIFEPFFTTKEVGRGTGQALGLARSIVAQHGGKLSFTSRTGGGTRFTVQLPVDGPRPAEPA